MNQYAFVLIRFNIFGQVIDDRPRGAIAGKLSDPLDRFQICITTELPVFVSADLITRWFLHYGVYLQYCFNKGLQLRIPIFTAMSPFVVPVLTRGFHIFPVCGILPVRPL